MKKLLALLFLCFFIGVSQEKALPAIELLQKFDRVRDFTLSENGDEAYFTIQSPTEAISVICKSLKMDGIWSKPVITSFSGKYKDLEPFLAPDGLRLFFVSDRQLNDSIAGPKDFDIWYVERTTPDADWSAPTNLGSPVNTLHNEFYPALAENGNLYFTSDHPNSKGRDDIFFSALKNGSYNKPSSLGTEINSEGFEYNAYISKNESYLLFGGYNREDGLGSGDIYISFKDVSGQWSQAKPLPQPVNSAQMDYCPFVDEKSNTLYFTSRRVTLPNSEFKDIESLRTYLNSYENGQSRIYKAYFNDDAMKKDIKD